jgi:hypothetical protein
MRALRPLRLALPTRQSLHGVRQASEIGVRSCRPVMVCMAVKEQLQSSPFLFYKLTPTSPPLLFGRDVETGRAHSR